MRVETLRLRAFRNFKTFQLELHPKIHFLVGPNGWGKTNLLEAIWLATQGTSFRTADFQNLVQHGEQRAEVEAAFSLGIGTQRVRVELGPEGKIFWKDEKRTGVPGLKHLYSVVFSPGEIVAIRGYPQTRRERVDVLFSKLSPKYLKILREYKKTVLQRNRLLKTEGLSTGDLITQLGVWNQQLIATGNPLMEERGRWVERLSRLVQQYYQEIAGRESDAVLGYVPQVTSETFAQRLEASFELERVRKWSLVGPHRDDFRPMVGGMELRHFGSQGEGRSFTLALKLAEAALFQEIWHETPILLLDDVASELDEQRNRAFFHHLHSYEGQVLVTATARPLAEIPL